MIRIGQREFAVPFWLWTAVPFAFIAYSIYSFSTYLAIAADPDSRYLYIVRLCAVASLAGFLLIDLARRSNTPWYALPFLLLASLAASSLAVGWLDTALTEMARALVGLAIGAAVARGGTALVGLVLWAVMLAVPLFSGVVLALVFTFASRFLIGMPLWTRDTRGEFWANLGGAFLWLTVALGGYLAIRFSYGIALGYPASAVTKWPPLVAACLAALAATAVHLWLAYRFRKNELNSRDGIRVWPLAAICVAAFVYNPSVFGITGFRIMYDYIRPTLRAAHVLPTPDLVIAGYRVDVPYHDFKTTAVSFPAGTPVSYVTVPLPAEFGLTSASRTPRVFVYRREVTLQNTSTYWTDRRKVLEETQAKQPGEDAVAHFPGRTNALALRSNQYPGLDFMLADFNPETPWDVAEQALRRFIRERLHPVG
jgi:hypothetical protein